MDSALATAVLRAAARRGDSHSVANLLWGVEGLQSGLDVNGVDLESGDSGFDLRGGSGGGGGGFAPDGNVGHHGHRSGGARSRTSASVSSCASGSRSGIWFSWGRRRRPLISLASCLRRSQMES